jgi:hypothetical protein
MSNLTVFPSSLDGIKRLAKSIKREAGIPHHEALDTAAQRSGFQNFRHAQAQITGRITSSPLYPIYLSAYWAQKGASGRETLTIHLRKPLSEIVTATQVASQRHLTQFKVEAADHLERKADADNQAEARKEIFDAARTLEFMCATGLRPTTTQKQRNLMEHMSSVPGHDHSSEWIHPESGSWVFLDEPYPHVSLGDRQSWADRKGLTIAHPSWKGLYYPGGTAPYFFSPDRALLNAIEHQLTGLRFDQRSPEWDGESSSYYSAFISPARTDSGKPRRARPMPAHRGVERNGSLPYGARRGGQKSDWRPAKRMELDMHLTVGPIIAALANGLRGRKRDAISLVRSMLDDWIQMEYPSAGEMSQEQFRDSYYGTHREPITAQGEQLKAVDRIVELLRAGYADCPPRNQLIQRLLKTRVQLAA